MFCDNRHEPYMPQSTNMVLEIGQKSWNMKKQKLQIIYCSLWLIEASHFFHVTIFLLNDSEITLI